MRCIRINVQLILLTLFFPFNQANAFDGLNGKEIPTSSLAVDASLWLATYAMETYWVQPEGVREFPTSGFDNAAREVIHGAHVDELYNSRETSWRNYSDLGITGIVVGTIGTSFTTRHATLNNLILVNRAFAVNNFATTFLKNAVHRSRPKAALNSAVPQDGDNAKSFPSGHSSNAMVAATSIVLMTPDKPAIFHAAIYGLGASIGIARIMADRHFLTDVLLGAALGIGVTHAVFKDQKVDDARLVAGLTSFGYRFVF